MAADHAQLILTRSVIVLPIRQAILSFTGLKFRSKTIGKPKLDRLAEFTVGCGPSRQRVSASPLSPLRHQRRNLRDRCDSGGAELMDHRRSRSHRQLHRLGERGAGGQGRA